MKRNAQVQAACDRLIAQLRDQVNSLNDRRYIFERIARLPFAEEDAQRIAANLNQIADIVDASEIVQTQRDNLAVAKDLDRGYREMSARLKR